MVVVGLWLWGILPRWLVVWIVVFPFVVGVSLCVGGIVLWGGNVGLLVG